MYDFKFNSYENNCNSTKPVDNTYLLHNIFNRCLIKSLRYLTNNAYYKLKCD